MITTGANLLSFINSLNADAEVDATLADVLVDTARTVLEAERPWSVLKKTNSSLTAATSDTWQTAKTVSGISGWSGQFYGAYPVRLFDGSNRIHRYEQVPFEDRLEWKDVGSTFVYDANAGVIYLNGVVPFAGTLYINYIHDTGALDLASASAVWSPFPARFLPVLGYYAIGIHKGAVDYDEINRAMLPENRATMNALKNAMTSWDDALQLASREGDDPTEPLGTYPRSGAVDRYS